MNLHHLKTWPIPFTAIWDGLKPFEIRKDDRNFQVGDELVLQIWDPGSKTYGRRTIEATVTYKTNDEKWGLLPGHCVLGLGNIRRIERAEPASHSPSALRPPPSPSTPSMGFTRMTYEKFREHSAKLEPFRMTRVLDLYRGVASAAAGDSLSPKDGATEVVSPLVGLDVILADRDEWKLRALQAEQTAATQSRLAAEWDLAHGMEHGLRVAAEKALEERTRERDEYLARWREAHREASRAATEGERRRAEGEGQRGSPEAIDQPRGMSETMVKIVACGDGEDTRRCTRWFMPVGTVDEMLDDLAEGAPTKTPYHAWLRGSPSDLLPMTPVDRSASLKGFEGKTLLVYAEGREADRLAYANHLRQAQFSAAHKVVGTPRQCKDGGACHHECGEGSCWRESNCAPLSGSGLGDDWKPK